MVQLYVMRHGIALPHGTPGMSDDDRPLTTQGEQRVRQVARGLKQLDLNLERIVSSPLPRAFRTAEIVASVLECNDILESDDGLRAGASAESIRDWLGGRSEQRLMIVGHNPAFEDLVGLLATGSQSAGPICVLRRGGIAALRTYPDGSTRLDWLARPRLLRR
jgi:phosphohistidine phosphatase